MADSLTEALQEWLRIQRKGALMKELAAALAEVNLAVVDTGKAGKVTVTISVKSAGDDVSVIITDKVAKQVPEHDRGQSIFFVDEEGAPQRSQQVLTEHPADQPGIPNLRAVPNGAQPVNPATGEVL